MSDHPTSEFVDIEAVRGFPFLEGIDDAYIRRIVETFPLVRHDAGTLLFAEHQPAEHCYLLLDGTVVLEICGTSSGCTPVQTVGRGELLGWSTVLGADAWTMTARVVEPMAAIQINGAQLRQWCDEDHTFGYQAMRATAKTLARRLTATRLLLLDMYQEGRGM